MRDNLSLMESGQRFVLKIIKRLGPVEKKRIERRLARAANGGKVFFLGPNLGLDDFLEAELRRMEIRATSTRPPRYRLTPLGLRRLQSRQECFFISPP
jgi:hypothetical protein